MILEAVPAPPAKRRNGHQVIKRASRHYAEALSRLVLQDDGNLVIYDPNDHPLWATNTWQPDLPAHWATAPDGTLLAAVGDPAVYVMIGGKRHHVPDPQTFEAEGYDWSNIHWISLEELNNVPLGDPVPHVTRFIIDTGDQHLGRNHYMHTKCGIDLTTGEVAGTTRVWTLHGSAASTAWFRSSLWTAPACRLPRTSPSGMA